MCNYLSKRSRRQDRSTIPFARLDEDRYDEGARVQCAHAPLDDQPPSRPLGWGFAADLAAGDGDLGAELFRRGHAYLPDNHARPNVSTATAAWHEPEHRQHAWLSARRLHSAEQSPAHGVGQWLVSPPVRPL